jgi:hypothetical protein
VDLIPAVDQIPAVDGEIAHYASTLMEPPLWQEGQNNQEM